LPLSIRFTNTAPADSPPKADEPLAQTTLAPFRVELHLTKYNSIGRKVQSL
jgi:hypothetical protein